MYENVMDVDILAERILLDLKNTFKKDPLIDEFDVLPVRESNSNTCPVIHIEHKVALEDWCVKHVYVYAYSKFFTWRKRPYKVDPDCLLMWTSAILLINPETETVWNARKELVCQNLLFPENELKFSELVLSRKPKSSPVYAHRKWILLELKKSNCHPCTLQQIVEHEMSLCTRFATLYPSNYHAWCHRSWVLKELCGMCSKTVSDELNRTERWSSIHVSDHSGLHYRQLLLSSLSNPLTTQPCPLHTTSHTDVEHSPHSLTRELAFLCSLQAVYPGHEALWYHRRYILKEMGLKRNSIEWVVQVKRHKLECDWDLEREEAFLKETSGRTREGDWERTLIEKHVKWLADVLSWPLLSLR